MDSRSSAHLAHATCVRRCRSGVPGGFLFAVAIVLAWMLSPPAVLAQTASLCAAVRIEIQQDLALERQAFDAHMRIHNGLTHVDLTDIRITVRFEDGDGVPVEASSDPQDTDAAFFLRLDDLQGIDAVDGSGRVAAGSTADVRWLIIPAPGAAGEVPSGTLYSVGADLTYNAGGDVTTVSVTPDVITVRPIPRLALDYFLPRDVYADDPLTAEIEPAIPFHLGLRVRNNGHGTAARLKIDSAQPRIVDNEQGLLVNFTLLGTRVNDQGVDNSLLVDFGNVPAQGAATARWSMATTLSGEFVDFGATYSHADSLGGELTSLIDATTAHTLVHDVLADLPGRDGIRDFLAIDGSSLTLYESSGIDTAVADLSANATLTPTTGEGSASYWSLTSPAHTGFSAVQLPDPHEGRKQLRSVLRDDGKELPAHNAWLSQRRTQTGDWAYFVHLFDAHSSGRYRLAFEDPVIEGQGLQLQYIPDREVLEGQSLAFLVEASDASGEPLAFGASPLPAGAGLAVVDADSARFSWNPAIGQAGRYVIAFQASNGGEAVSRSAVITVRNHPDADGDGLPDDWELEYFGHTGRDGNGDYDGDGISDRAELEQGFDPTRADGPSVPWIVQPLPGTEVDTLTPLLAVEGSAPAMESGTMLRFQVLDDGVPSGVLHEAAGVAMEASVTGWTPPVELTDNRRYTWRVRGEDGGLAGAWRYGDFFVNTANDPPGTVRPAYPGDGDSVDRTDVTLVNLVARDIDEDVLQHRFEVFDAAAMSAAVVTSPPVTQQATGLELSMNTVQWTVPADVLVDGESYAWRSVVVDGHGAETTGPLQAFTIDTTNRAPSLPSMTAPGDGEAVAASTVLLTVANADDADGDTVEYFFELDTRGSFDGPGLAVSGPVSEGVESTQWSVSGLEENERYFWRVRASDGAAGSGWVSGSFFVDAVDEVPGPPGVVNPGNGAWFDGTGPRLALQPGPDVDRQGLAFDVEIYADADLTEWVAGSYDGEAEWPLPDGSLLDDTRYYWRARASDPAGNTSEWGPVHDLFVNDDDEQDPPRIGLIEPGSTVVVDADHPVVLVTWQDGDEDSNAEIRLYYDDDATGFDGVPITAAIPEDDAADRYAWEPRGLAPGTYHVYAVITDGASEDRVYAAGQVVIGEAP